MNAMTAMVNFPPRFYAACLASYNNGVLHGAWIDASSDVDEMQEDVNRMLRASPCPNTMVDCPYCDGAGTLESKTAAQFKNFECLKCVGSGKVPSAEEFAIHDHEGLGDIGEFARLDDIAKRMEIIDAADDAGIPSDVLLEAMDNYASEGTSPEDFIGEQYRGSAETWAEYAEDFHEECGDMESVPDFVKYHIDWDSVANEMQHSGLTGFYYQGTLYIFSSC